MFNAPKKNASKETTKGKAEKGKDIVKSEEENEIKGGEQEVKDDIQADDTTVLDDSKDDLDVADKKRKILNSLSQIADMHERIKK